jgi:hypothetical protein
VADVLGVKALSLLFAEEACSDAAVPSAVAGKSPHQGAYHSRAKRVRAQSPVLLTAENETARQQHVPGRLDCNGWRFRLRLDHIGAGGSENLGGFR